MTSDIFILVNLSALDLNLLLVLDAVVAERSVARAAKRLHVTSPAISNALGRLRDALGDPIVTRSGRGIVPTPRALELAPVIARALHDIDAAVHGGAFDPRTARGQLTLAIADAGQIARLPRLTAALGSAMPNVRLRVVDVDTMISLGGLAGTEVDVAIGVSEPAAGIHRRALYDERAVVIARKKHPRIGARASKSALAAERHVEIHVVPGKASRAVERSYAQLGIVREIAVIVPTFTAAAAIVSATDLIATLPASVVSALAPAFELRIVSSPVRPLPATMYLSWHDRTHDDPTMSFFREVIERVTSSTSA